MNSWRSLLSAASDPPEGRLSTSNSLELASVYSRSLFLSFSSVWSFAYSERSFRTVSPTGSADFSSASTYDEMMASPCEVDSTPHSLDTHRGSETSADDRTDRSSRETASSKRRRRTFERSVAVADEGRELKIEEMLKVAKFSNLIRSVNRVRSLTSCIWHLGYLRPRSLDRSLAHLLTVAGILLSPSLLCLPSC